MPHQQAFEPDYLDRVGYYLAADLQTTGEIVVKHPGERMSYGDIPLIPAYNKLRELLTSCGRTDSYFLLGPRDVGQHRDRYELSKIRFPGSRKTTLVRSIKFHRHWRLVYDRPPDRPFSEKRDRLVWRGAPTGLRQRRSYDRLSFVKRYQDLREDIDVGFRIKFNENFDLHKKHLGYARNELSPEEMLLDKYIVSIEGNDKDSGLNWKLNSNSLVLMSAPTRSSWLMEDQLVPGVHYVRLEDDFSDLEEKLAWCRDNQDKCMEIVENSTRFMQRFMDLENEARIEREVVTGYFRKMSPLLGKVAATRA